MEATRQPSIGLRRSATGRRSKTIMQAQKHTTGSRERIPQFIFFFFSLNSHTVANLLHNIFHIFPVEPIALLFFLLLAFSNCCCPDKTKGAPSLTSSLLVPYSQGVFPGNSIKRRSKGIKSRNQSVVIIRNLKVLLLALLE